MTNRRHIPWSLPALPAKRLAGLPLLFLASTIIPIATLGKETRTTLTHGTSRSPSGLAQRTTREITIENHAGHTLQSETRVYDGSDYQTIAWRSHTLNDLGQTIATISSDGSHTTTAWGYCGPESETAADGTVTEYAYDALQRPTLTTRVGHGDQPDTFTETTYDAAGRVTSAISYGGTSVSLLTTNTYDLAGHLTRTASSSADGVYAATLYEYDELGNLLLTCQDLNLNGQIDLAGPDRITGSDSRYVQLAGDWWHETTSWTYLDPTSLSYGGTSVSALTNAISRTRLTGLGTPYSADGASGTLTAETHSIDHLGNLSTSRTFVDRANQTVYHLTTSPASTVAALTTTVNGLLVASHSSSGHTTTYSYDGLGRQIASQDARGATHSRAYDPIGNRLSSTEYDPDNNPLVSSYTANALNQYQERTIPGYAPVRGSATNTATVTVNGNPAWRLDDYFYGGDTVDNSTAALLKELEIVAAYSNNYSAVTGNVFVTRTPEQYQYDEDGNLIQDGRWQYTWNGENRLVKAVELIAPTNRQPYEVNYAYDHQGRMVWKQVSTNAVMVFSRMLLWDGHNIVWETIDHQPSTTNYYVWGLDLSGSLQGTGGIGGLLAASLDGTTAHYTYSANGDVSQLIEPTTGDLLAHYEYSPFGETVVATGPLATLRPCGAMRSLRPSCQSLSLPSTSVTRRAIGFGTARTSAPCTIPLNAAANSSARTRICSSASTCGTSHSARLSPQRGWKCRFPLCAGFSRTRV